MEFPFETTMKNGRKATVLGTAPDGRLIGYIEFGDSFPVWYWDANGGDSDGMSITIPLQIKPLTTYRMRNGQLAWTSGRIKDGWILGVDSNFDAWNWNMSNGRWDDKNENSRDLIEEIPSMENQK